MSLAAIIMNLTPVTPIPPTPRPRIVPTVGPSSQPGGGGEIPSPTDWDRDETETEDEIRAGPPAPTPGAEPPAVQVTPGVPPPVPTIEPVPAVEAVPQFIAIATSLTVLVRATILHVKPVERGNLVYFIAPFAGPPDEVFFSSVAPGSSTTSIA